MQELLRTIVAGLVEDPSAIAITEDAPNEEGVIVYHLHVAADDMGRVIGKQGRMPVRFGSSCVLVLQRAIRKLQLKLIESPQNRRTGNGTSVFVSRTF